MKNKYSKKLIRKKLIRQKWNKKMRKKIQPQDNLNLEKKGDDSFL